MDKILLELKKPLQRNDYALFLTLSYLICMIAPFASTQAIYLITPLSYIGMLVNLYLVARRISGLNQNLWFTLISAIPFLGFIFQVYLIFVDEEIFEGHRNYLKQNI